MLAWIFLLIGFGVSAAEAVDSPAPSVGNWEGYWRVESVDNKDKLQVWNFSGNELNVVSSWKDHRGWTSVSPGRFPYAVRFSGTTLTVEVHPSVERSYRVTGGNSAAVRLEPLWAQENLPKPFTLTRLTRREYEELCAEYLTSANQGIPPLVPVPERVSLEGRLTSTAQPSPEQVAAHWESAKSLASGASVSALREEVEATFEFLINWARIGSSEILLVGLRAEWNAESQALLEKTGRLGLPSHAEWVSPDSGHCPIRWDFELTPAVARLNGYVSLQNPLKVYQDDCVPFVERLLAEGAILSWTGARVRNDQTPMEGEISELTLHLVP